MAEKRKIMGFGYHLLDLYEALARAMYDAKGLHPNLDYPAGPAYHQPHPAVECVHRTHRTGGRPGRITGKRQRETDPVW
ncbi:hypothetical protein GCM10027598_72950 [Amycolatopsis oliviviridis]|uniref:Uncharacterized protein n=1 Tax=Amycolatopsis oliviviridis TaxID=1471590 RepID=A0ABQ3L4M4_9PSEU|nr:hypothetical protein GCM10017790_02880 [Amycolatopsis oliviviridis]